MTRRTLVGILALATLVVAGAHAEASSRSLAGTHWRWVEFRSMDDAIGTIAPEGPSQITMHLKADSTVTLQLDCNQATGRWSADPATGARSGRFRMGPLAATQALCPPPRFGERIARDAEFVRSYLLEDGRLYLSLLADAGIHVWEPLTEQTPEADDRSQSSRASTDSALHAAILRATPDYTREMVEISGTPARYVAARADLDGDGLEEVFVYLMGSIFCGTGGCDLLLFTPRDGDYSLVSTFPLTRMPVVISPSSSAGWKDLYRLQSGGGVEPSFWRHAFDGHGYVRKESRSADRVPLGSQVFDADVTFEAGAILEPTN